MTDITDCCQAINPCEAVCMLENTLIQLAMGQTVTSYKVGAESWSFKTPTIEQVNALLTIYQGKCNKAQGKTARPRARACIVFGNHTCGGCHRTSSRCRCG